MPANIDMLPSQRWAGASAVVLLTRRPFSADAADASDVSSQEMFVTTSSFLLQGEGQGPRGLVSG